MACHLEFSDDRFIFAGKSYPDLPLLVDSKHQFVQPVCEYFRYLILMSNLKTSSVKTYADYIRHFWNHLETSHTDFMDVCDKDLVSWLNSQEADGVSSITRCYRCDVVFDFYVWLEWNGYVQNFVRIPGWNDSEKFVPCLTSAKIKHGGMRLRRSSKFGIVSAVRPKVTFNGYLATPGSEDLTKIYIAADNEVNPRLTERNHLLIDWYSQVGLRRQEWRLLTLDQIPSWCRIYELQQHSEAYELRLFRTKGGRIRHVGVIPELLEKTREYIEGTREVIVARFKASKGRLYNEPVEVFLSEKTGNAMALTAITNMLTMWFKVAGVEGHGHRLRATYLTNLFEAELAAEQARISAHPGTKVCTDFELILRKVAERAGHAHIDSLRPYLTLARKRQVREHGQVDPVTLQQQIEAKQQELAILEYRIKERRDEIDLIKQTKLKT